MLRHTATCAPIATLLVLLTAAWSACGEPECPYGFLKVGKICRRVDAGTALDASDSDEEPADASRDESPSDGGLDAASGQEDAQRRGDHASLEGGTGADAVVDSGASEGSDGGRDANAPDASPIAELQGVQQLSAGAAHTCAVLTSGSLVCWGSNASGQLGDGTKTNRAAPVTVLGITGAVEVACGSAHTCARRTSGAVACWGANGAGQLGDGTTEDRLSPTAVSGALNARKLAAGATGTCAITSEDKVACWGEGSDATPKNVYLPTGGFEQIAVGSAFACVSFGPIACWGSNMMGTSQGAVSAVRDVAAGDNHACVVTRDSMVACWGQNDVGQLGLRTTQPVMGAMTVENVADAVEVTAGKTHACARLVSGAVKCWGSNSAGQLGSMTMGTLAVLVPGLSSPVEISAGAEHTCVREQRGTVRCWGRNTHGQLGQGNMNDVSSPTLVVAGGRQ
jgi:alpha-tubulin suppressor-like RCC1 family protein